MSVPSVSLTVVDGGLGAIAANTDQLAVVMGPSSDGTPNVPTLISSASALSAFGYGPGVSLALACTQASGQPVLFVRTETTADGSAGAVTHHGSGSSVMTLSGPFHDGADLVVTVAPQSSLTVGSGVARLSISLDGGRSTIGTYSLTGTSLELATLGCTLNFGGGSLAIGDVYQATITGPESDLASLEYSMDIVSQLATPVPSMFFDATLAGRSYADCVALEAKLASFAVDPSVALPARLVTSAAPHTAGATLAAQFAPLSALHVAVGATYARPYDFAQKSYIERPFGWAAMARFVSTDAHTDAAQVSLGALPGVLEVGTDQRIDPTLDTARFIAPITFRGLQGFYVCNPNLMAPAGSDYSLMQYGRVMDKICRTARAYFLRSLSSSVRLDPTTGYILEKDAQSLEQGCDAALRAAVITSGDVSSVTTHVSRTDNISATKTINVTVRAIPLGYLKHINVTLQFVNPANA